MVSVKPKNELHAMMCFMKLHKISCIGTLVDDEVSFVSFDMPVEFEEIVGHRRIAKKYLVAGLKGVKRLLYSEKRLFLDALEKLMGKGRVGFSFGTTVISSFFDSALSKKVQKNITPWVDTIVNASGKKSISEVELNESSVKSSFHVLSIAVQGVRGFLNEEGELAGDTLLLLSQKISKKDFSDEDAKEVANSIGLDFVKELEKLPRLKSFSELIKQLRMWLLQG
jgi:hypothetical protein